VLHVHVAELIGVSTRDRVTLRHKVEEFLDEADGSHALDGISTAAIKSKIQEFLLQEKAMDPELATMPVKISSLSRQVTLVVLLASAVLILFPSRIWEISERSFSSSIAAET